MIEELFDEVFTETHKQSPPIPEEPKGLIEEEPKGLIEEEPKGLIEEIPKGLIEEIPKGLIEEEQESDSCEYISKHRHPMHLIIKKWLGIN